MAEMLRDVGTSWAATVTWLFLNFGPQRPQKQKDPTCCLRPHLIHSILKTLYIHICIYTHVYMYIRIYIYEYIILNLMFVWSSFGPLGWLPACLPS